ECNLRIRISFEFRHGSLFCLTISGVALHKYREVDAMSVELGTVHAGKFTFAIDQDAASAAHASAVDHDGIKADDRADVFLARHFRNCPHHRNWTHSQHQVDARAVLDELPQFIGDEAFV